MAESRIPQEDKAGAQREYQQGKGVRGQQGMVQEGSTAATAQVCSAACKTFFCNATLRLEHA